MARAKIKKVKEAFQSTIRQILPCKAEHFSQFMSFFQPLDFYIERLIFFLFSVFSFFSTLSFCLRLLHPPSGTKLHRHHQEPTTVTTSQPPRQYHLRKSNYDNDDTTKNNSSFQSQNDDNTSTIDNNYHENNTPFQTNNDYINLPFSHWKKNKTQPTFLRYEK